MKYLRILAVVAILGILTIPAQARKFVPRSLVADSDGTAISSYSIGAGVNVTTSAIPTDQAAGFNSLVVDCSGQIDIYQQVSMDGTNFYDPYTTDGTSLTSASGVVANLTADRWIIFTQRVAKYIRFYIHGDSASTVTLNYHQQEAE